MSEHPTRRALVIGIGDYPGLRQPGLARTVASAVDDARAFRDWLVDGRCLDRSCDRRLVPAEVLFHLSPAAPDARPATRDAIRASVRELLADPPKAELFVYFSGHGFAVRDQVIGPAVDYLVLEDFESLAVSGDSLIHVPYLFRLLSACGPGVQYFFIDACRNEAVSGAIAGGHLGGLNFPPSAAGAPDQLRMFSTRGGAQAAGQSTFSPLLVRALRGEGRAKQWQARDDRPDELVVRFDSVFRFVRDEMARAGTPQLPAADRLGGDADLIDVIDPPPRVRCTVAFTPAQAAEGSTVTARIRDAVAGTAQVRGGTAEFELLPDHYHIVPSRADRLFRPALRREPIWDARELSPFEAFVDDPHHAVRGSATLDLIVSAPQLDREIYTALRNRDGTGHRESNGLASPDALEAFHASADRSHSIVNEIAARPAWLHVVVPAQPAALTCRVETLSGRAMHGQARGGRFAFRLPPDTYRLRLSQYGAAIHDVEIDASPGAELMVEPARELERSALRRHIQTACGGKGGGLATPDGPLLDGDLALWLAWWMCAAPPAPGPVHDDRVVVVAATQRPVAALYVADAGGQDGSGAGSSVLERLQVGDRAIALVRARFDDHARWVVAQAPARDGRPVRTGFALPIAPDRASLVVLVEGTDGELDGSLHQLRVPLRGGAGDRRAEAAEWHAVRIASLAQRALRHGRRVDLAALIGTADLADVAARSPVGLTALRLLARRHDARPLLSQLDGLAGAVDGDERAVLLDAVRDPARLALPAGAQLRWDRTVVSYVQPAP